jgi:glycerophosphoryl diester phosphodiesterase
MTQVIAHRGASNAAPENTVAAFQMAAELGADAVELDVRRTSDGVLVVHHNPHVADGRVIAELTAADLPGQVPTLAAALDACAGMWVNVEIKNDPREPDFDPGDRIADDTISELIARGEHGRWLISSFRLSTVDRCRELSTEIRTAWLTVDAPNEVAALLHEHGHSAWHPWVGALAERHVGDCHRHGIQVNAWTCDDVERISELIAWGVDGICTNVPDVALAVRRGQRP